jgi:N-glycosylase/DNA lyase
MQYSQHNNEIEITGVEEFDPVKIFECGQCFRWNPEHEGSYTGVAMGRAARVRREGGSVFITGTADDFESVWRGYFDLDRDYGAIGRTLGIDDYMTEAVRHGAGIRILKQDKWEALCSFILSQCNNIPRIKQIIGKFCVLFGTPIEFEGRTVHAFPSAEKTAALTDDALAPIRCGFRASALLEAARAVASGDLDLEAIARLTPQGALEALKKLSRVGDKVAHCVMLFGLQMLDAFPVDTWIRKTLDKRYPGGLDPRLFSPYAGIAQQYMFYEARCAGKRDISA